jgi:hypothetical protein
VVQVKKKIGNSQEVTERENKYVWRSQVISKEHSNK